MSDKSKIPWCDATWNPIVGCTPIAAGCKNCYAKALHDRRHKAYMAGAKLPKQYARPFSEIQLLEGRLSLPGRWKEPRRVFVNSMSDLFHEDVPFEFAADVYDEMICCPKHTFIVLTKRPDRMFEFSKWYGIMPEAVNVHLGVSISTQEDADRMIPLLLQTPAAVRFVSIEPMLEGISLGGFDGRVYRPWLDHHAYDPMLSWVICGAESGPGARPFSMDWARGLRDQCQAVGVPFFFKQGVVDGRLVKMPELDGQVWAQFPEVV